MEKQTGSWSIATGNKEGNLILIRKRNDIENAKSFSSRVIVNMDWIDPQIQTAIEDQLSESVEEKSSLFVLSLTSEGNKRFVFYTANPDQVKEVLDKYIQAHQDLGITYFIETDPTWDFYQSFSA